MPKKLTKAEIEAQQDRAIANAERLRALLEKAEAERASRGRREP